MKDNHPLKSANVHSLDEEMYTLIDQEIDNLIKAFAIVATDLKTQLKRYDTLIDLFSFVSSHSLKELFALYNAVIERKDARIEEL